MFQIAPTTFQGISSGKAIDVTIPWRRQGKPATVKSTDVWGWENIYNQFGLYLGNCIHQFLQFSLSPLVFGHARLKRRKFGFSTTQRDLQLLKNRILHRHGTPFATFTGLRSRLEELILLFLTLGS